jgi:hypothetical protein
VVVEPRQAFRVIGQIGENISPLDFEKAVRNVLGVDELNGVDRLGFGDEDGTAQPIEIPARHQAHGLFSFVC